MKASQIISFTCNVYATCNFFIYLMYNNESENITNERMKPVPFEASHIEPAKVYPNYYEDDFRSEWQFNITKNYAESDMREWSEPKNIRTVDAYGVGEGGRGYVPPDDNTKKIMNKLQKENNFNLLASEMISLHRSLPDRRYTECKNLSYPEKLPTTSVIIVFHNEAWTTLLRTVWSIINRSPIELIEEIILVDDMSTWPVLKRPLDDYIDIVPSRIKLIRNTKREGLIRARLIGAQHATGHILTFFDAHVECCDGWLQPLLARIASDRSVIAVPVIDNISSADMSYIYSKSSSVYGFHWSLMFHSIPIPQRELIRTQNDKTAPVRTPTMIGCAFSIDKEFFFEIGSYDEGMDIWGSENMEMSLRVWQCGGSMEILPCSHVGHLFRMSTYSFEGNAHEIKSRNSMRVVDVWLPEFREIFFVANSWNKKYSSGDISERIELKQRMKCKSFRWFLESVHPESVLNNEFLYFGEIKSASRKGCLDIYTAHVGNPVKIIPCHNEGGNQIFGLTKAQKLVTRVDLCVGVVRHSVVSVHCMESPQWKYDVKTKWLIHVESKRCMQAKKSEVKLGKCDSTDDTFNWNLSAV